MHLITITSRIAALVCLCTVQSGYIGLEYPRGMVFEVVASPSLVPLGHGLIFIKYDIHVD